MIEILYERVAYHKDKFVAPILHNEMQSMEVKKNGKVEHSQNTHDDQVFSYLMALYVWYDGKNLAENFHIIKNTLKTDQDEEFEELDIEESLESTAKVDVSSVQFDEESEVYQTLTFIEKNAKLVTTKDIKDQQYMKNMEQRDFILATNKAVRESYAKQTGVDPKMYENSYGASYVTLPDHIYSGFELDPKNDQFDEDYQYNVVQGNLSDLWSKV